MEMGTFTLVLAIWGAILSTGLAAFEIYKWNRSRTPQLRVDISPPLTEFGKSDDSPRFLYIRITNVGDRSTTLHALTWRYYESKPDRSFKYKAAKRGVVRYKQTKFDLPRKLETGEVWEVVVPYSENIQSMAENGYLYFEIEDSSTMKANKYARSRCVTSWS